ncbi:hypothetical protein GCM10011360_23740 [Primorskyibacter flagellatus]|uniref:C-type lectin domain-containing protein n=1 Tax=Primorskyibacter flagellatus TaxID=1387277 RepID=A0A917AAH9_9RHOB|nr:VPLPA-CTERM sorting domain-containing protein [Primorskyibacter flagellatus]GGE35157.1 hypothetical protein GCM10011360_23740 [Primorskyibacter flagellatus]
MKAFLAPLAACAALSPAAPAIAAPVTFSGNGHSYELVLSLPVTWDYAKTEAETRGGYLATVTSQEEWDFIVALNSGNMRAWLGGTDSTDYGTTEGNWIWATGPETGQAITFNAWGAGEPNNSGGNEHFLEGWWNPYWNDVPGATMLEAYIVEYAPAVPLPASAPLILAGLGAFGVFHRRRQG